MEQLLAKEISTLVAALLDDILPSACMKGPPAARSLVYNIVEQMFSTCCAGK